jgi:SAM-dependent methyltransferase
MITQRLRKRLSRRPPGDAGSGKPSGWVAAAPSPWEPEGSSSLHACNICRWSGDSFVGDFHSEMAQCPQCGSVARDRFLFWSFTSRSPSLLGARVLETSPRLGDDYRSAMARWFSYLCSDYDEGAHRGTVRLDLQAIDRPDSSFDVILTPHVLEHVPDTGAALTEIRRVLATGGRMYLQVPLLQGRTAPPSTPEFHGDNTPVFWRFGFDLTQRLREHGFTTTLLCTQEWLDRVDEGSTQWPVGVSPEFDVASMLAGVRRDDLAVVAEADDARRYGFLPAYMFLTWECVAG